MPSFFPDGDALNLAANSLILLVEGWGASIRSGYGDSRPCVPLSHLASRSDNLAFALKCVHKGWLAIVPSASAAVLFKLSDDGARFLDTHLARLRVLDAASMADIEQVAESMLKRYSSAKIAREMAFMHAMDYPEHDDRHQRWIAIRGAIARRSETR